MPVEHIIAKFLRSYRDLFTIDDFAGLLREMEVKISNEEIEELIKSFDCVFELEGNRYITRAGAFTGYYFSFMPTKEEIEKGVFIAGDRCMPFVDNEIVSSCLNFYCENHKLRKKVCEFNAGLLMDIFSLYGDEYSSQVIASDPANYGLKLSETDFNLPPVTKMTCFDISGLINEGKFSYGDRFLCYVENWAENRIYIEPVRRNTEKLVLDPKDLERENWYGSLENSLLKEFDTVGPCDSIESQLAFTFINNFKELSVEGCGSVEELMLRTKKIGYEPYGVESRLWRRGDEIPVVGTWNQDEVDESIKTDHHIEMTENDIAPDYVVDAYIKDCLFSKSIDFEKLKHKIYPNFGLFNKELQEKILLRLKNRHDILNKTYNYFADYNVGVVRKKVIKLFSDVNALTIRIGIECNDVSNLPSQELVVLGQLHQQLLRFLEALKYDNMDLGEALTDMDISVENMQMSFDVIGEELNRVVNIESKKGFDVGKSFDKGEV